MQLALLLVLLLLVQVDITEPLRLIQPSAYLQLVQTSNKREAPVILVDVI